jgi:hypothetical protein
MPEHVDSTNERIVISEITGDLLFFFIGGLSGLFEIVLDSDDRTLVSPSLAPPVPTCSAGLNRWFPEVFDEYFLSAVEWQRHFDRRDRLI